MAEAFHDAASRGDLSEVERYIAARGNVNAVVDKKLGGTALYFAVLNGHIDIVKRLIAAGANIHQGFKKGLKGVGRHGLLPLFAAVTKGYIEIFELLIAAGAVTDINKGNNVYTPLELAVANVSLQFVSRLIELGATVTDEALMIAVRNPQINENERNVYQIVDLLIKNGANVDAWIRDDEQTPLVAAAKNHHLEIIRDLMLPRASDPRYLNMALYEVVASAMDNQRYRHLRRNYTEIKERLTRIIQLLIDRGANPLDDQLHKLTTEVPRGSTAFDIADAEFKRVMYPSPLLNTARVVQTLPLGAPRLSSTEIQDILGKRGWERRRHAVTGWAQMHKRNEGTYGGNDVHSGAEATTTAAAATAAAAAATNADATGAAVTGGSSGGGGSNGSGSQGGGARRRKTNRRNGNKRKTIGRRK